MLNHDDDTDGDDDDYGDDADDGDDDGDVNFQFVFDMFVLKWPFRVITLFLLIRFCVSMSYITCCLCICWCFAVSSFCWIFNLGFHVFAVFLLHVPVFQMFDAHPLIQPNSLKKGEHRRILGSKGDVWDGVAKRGCSKLELHGSLTEVLRGPGSGTPPNGTILVFLTNSLSDGLKK